MGAIASGSIAQEQEVEEVIVQGIRSADLNARDMERDKEAFTSIISQDDAGNFSDQNVAESLQRLPGITLQKTEGEGRFVTVRGLGPGFVTVNMNGSELASSNSDTRAFALDAIPADLLGSIEVFKSLTPDMDLNSIGGAVNVKSIDPFGRGKNSLKLNLQNYQQDFDGEASPKISVQGTQLFADETIGLGYSFSHETRNTKVYETRHHSDTNMRYIQVDVPGVPAPTADSPRMLIPFEFETREEDAERERNAGSLDFGFRPNDISEYYARATRTELVDLDIALREYYRFGQALVGHSAYVDPDSNTFGVVNADLQHQFFIQDGTSTTDAYAIGGKNLFDDWTFDYDYSRSIGEFEKPDGRRVQFRTRFLPLLGRYGEDFINGQVVSPAQMSSLGGGDFSTISSTIGGFGGANGYQAGQRVQSGMIYDNIFIEDSFRTDTLDQISVNLRKDYDSGLVSYVKTGFKIKDRERDRNKDRWSIVPSNFPNGCGGNAECLSAINSSLGDYDTYTPNNPNFDHDFITFSETERLLGLTTSVAKFTDPNRTDQESRNEDYVLTEDTAAAYLMTELQLSEKSFLIAGARYEQTDFTSTGFFTIRNDRLEALGSAQVNDVAIALDGAEGSYDDVFPSLHYRYEMQEDLLLRASLWTSFTRPSFDQARAFAEIDGRVILCNASNVCSDDLVADLGASTPQDVQNLTLSSDNTLNLGNPTLTAMTSTNFDVSISWYDGEDRFLQAALFYKDIQDFIVSVSGANMALNALPMDLKTEQITQFIVPADLQLNNVNFATNGDSAELYGVELSYSEYFTGGFLDGFFVQSNLTLMSSEATVGDTLRVGKIQLPDQADQTLNLTLGWENNYFSARLITNYHSEILERVGSCSQDDLQADIAAGFPESCQTWADVYQDEGSGLDVKATYQITDDIKLYFDAINVTEQADIRYFQGNQFSGGKVLFLSEEFGRSYQIGLNIKLY